MSFIWQAGWQPILCLLLPPYCLSIFHTSAQLTPFALSSTSPPLWRSWKIGCGRWVSTAQGPLRSAPKPTRRRRSAPANAAVKAAMGVIGRGGAMPGGRRPSTVLLTFEQLD